MPYADLIPEHRVIVNAWFAFRIPVQYASKEYKFWTDWDHEWPLGDRVTDPWFFRLKPPDS